MFNISLFSILCLILLSFGSSSWAGLITIQSFDKDGRKVILFGDQHGSLNKEEAYLKWNSKAAAQWKEINHGLELYEFLSKDKKPLFVLYELQGSEISSNQELKKFYSEFQEFKANDTLSNFSLVKKEPLITCIDIEQRGLLLVFSHACDLLEEIASARNFSVFSSIGKMLNKVVDNDEVTFALWMNRYTSLQKDLFNTARFLKNHTLQTICDKYALVFENALQQKDEETSFHQVIKAQYTRYIQAYETFLKDLDQLSGSMKLSKNTDLYDYFVENMIFPKFDHVEKLGLIGQQFSRDGAFLVNDSETLALIEKETDKNILVFVGDAHSENIAHQLKKLGYSCDVCHHVDPQSFERLFDFRNKKNEINHLLDPELITSVISTMCVDRKQDIRNLGSSQHSEKKCNVCGQAGVKRCGQCKKINYCSQACQQKDWSSHKKNCHR